MKMYDNIISIVQIRYSLQYVLYTKIDGYNIKVKVWYPCLSELLWMALRLQFSVVGKTIVEHLMYNLPQ